MYKNSKRQPSNSRVITADWRSIDWAQADITYRDAADVAEQTALASYQQQMADRYPDAKLDQLVLTDRASIRRRAGNRAVAETFIKRNHLDSFGVHVVAQIVAHLAGLSLSTAQGEPVLQDAELLDIIRAPDNQVVGYQEPEFQNSTAISALAFVRAHFNTPEMMGIYRFLMLDSRSSYLTKQYTGDAKSYCSLVPLILSAFKRVHGIPYRAWKRDELHYVVNSDLAAAMLYEYDNTLDSDQLLQLRDQGLVWKSGPNVGKSRNPLYTHTLYGLKDTLLDDVPDLVQVMLTQIWCAHPENRTKYMVLDPNDWDRIPLALINPVIFTQPNYINQQKDLPWLN